MTAAGRIASLDDVRPGDIYMSNIGGIVPGLVPVKLGQLLLGEHVRIGRRSFDHAGVVTERGMLVEAMPSGAREVPLDPRKHWTPTSTFFRLAEDVPGQALDAARIARLMVGTPYSLASYAYLALHLRAVEWPALARHIDRRRDPIEYTTVRYGNTELLRLPVEAICSVLADQAWTLAGKSLIQGTKPQVVTPGMLAQHLWASAVARGGPGLL